MTGHPASNELVWHAVLELFRAHTPSYRPRWADHLTSAGDFEGRDFTLELFNVPLAEQRPLRRRLRAVLRQAEALLGSPLRLIFHTPVRYGEALCTMAGVRTRRPASG